MSRIKLYVVAERDTTVGAIRTAVSAAEERLMKMVVDPQVDDLDREAFSKAFSDLQKLRNVI